MIKAAHNRLYETFLGAYLHVHMRFAFSRIRINADYSDHGGSLLLIGNHFSWWDGFIARHVNNKLLQKKLHLMMDEDQLAKRKFLSKLGAFSIRRASRSAIESLDYASEILQDPHNLLVLYPQGRFQSLHQQPLSFEKGWFRIIKKAPHHMQIVFMAVLVDYFASPRPSLTIYLQDAVNNISINTSKAAINLNSTGNIIFKDAKAVEDAYNMFLGNVVGIQNDSIHKTA